MRPNVGSADRAVRIWGGIAFLSIAILGLGLFDGMIGGIVCATVGAIMLISGAVAYCPGYAIVGMGTCPAPKDKRAQ
ncbi:MAG: DUF2892 domain-containing protein [Phycisphaeraceae bacterium]|nr:DUF2892 domain-containing protein [Phycisphaeraceae bacterium]MCW5761738.1 DUF2892 domain-containing protein [Phycisphaeraceae bacterium]